jgi:hypothetical protein
VNGPEEETVASLGAAVRRDHVETPLATETRRRKMTAAGRSAKIGGDPGSDPDRQ